MNNPSIHDLLALDLQSIAEKFERFRRPESDRDVMVCGLLATALYVHGGDGPADGLESPLATLKPSPVLSDVPWLPLPPAGDLDTLSLAPAPGELAPAPGEEIGLVKADGTPAFKRHDLAAEWGGPLPSRPAPLPPARPTIVRAADICPHCQGTFDTHPQNQNGAAIDGQLPIILCGGGEAYLG